MSVFRDDILVGKVALVTGGGSGICQGIALTFAKYGAKVAVLGRTKEKLDGTVAQIEKAGGQALAVPADVRQPEAVEKAVAQTIETFGGIDVLINGAAGNFLCPVANLSYNAFRTVIEIDLEGTYNVTKACFKALSEAGGKHGNANVVNITATLQYTGVSLQAHASAAKAGIDALTRNLAQEWGPLGVRVNGVAPGPIRGTEGVTRLAPVPDAEKKLSKGIPLRRFGDIEEIAQTCLFLVSDASKYTTGTIVIVDGGQWLAGRGMGAGMAE